MDKELSAEVVAMVGRVRQRGGQEQVVVSLSILHTDLPPTTWTAATQKGRGKRNHEDLPRSTLYPGRHLLPNCLPVELTWIRPSKGLQP